MMTHPIDKMLDAKERMTPTEGFNLVGVDEYEEPGDELYLVGNFLSKNAANLERQRRLKENPTEKLHIYEPA
jgi:hypothetical protein